jgi:hypothetical protein
LVATEFFFRFTQVVQISEFLDLTLESFVFKPRDVVIRKARELDRNVARIMEYFAAHEDEYFKAQEEEL